jgi:hypothetical protein
VVVKVPPQGQGTLDTSQARSLPMREGKPAGQSIPRVFLMISSLGCQERASKVRCRRYQEPHALHSMTGALVACSDLVAQLKGWRH